MKRPRRRTLKWASSSGSLSWRRTAAACLPIVGVTSIPLAKGQFDEIDAKTLSSKRQARIDTEQRSISAARHLSGTDGECASCG
jgi:hypothetical protein